MDGHNAPLWAVVNSNATLASSNGATSVARTSAGNHSVVFDPDVSQCSYTATLGSSSSAFVGNGTVQATNSNQFGNTVWMRTQLRNGTEVDLGFHLVVNC